MGATDSSAITKTESYQALRQRLHSANAFRMGSSNSSRVTKPCACASIAFLTRNRDLLLGGVLYFTALLLR